VIDARIGGETTSSTKMERSLNITQLFG